MVAKGKFGSYSIVNDKAFDAQVKRAIQVTDDLRIPFKIIADDFYKSEKVIFNLKSAGLYPDFKGPKIGQTWKSPGRPKARTRPPNLTAYQHTKKKQFGFIYPLLKATGELEKSITKQGASGNITIIGKTSLVMGTDVEHAGFHQSDDARKKIPLRKFLFIGPESSRWSSTKQITGRLERWNNILNTFVLRELGASFGEATGT